MAFPCDNPRFEYEGKVYSADELKARLKSLDLKTASQFVDGLTVVPEMPMAKTWHELAFKRILRHAAEQGYSKVAWTTGETQAARYDLSKHIDSIKWQDNGDGTYDITPIDLEGQPIPQHQGDFTRVTPEKMEDVIGKEIAKKIVDRVGLEWKGSKSAQGKLSNLDLKVGGEGMKGFYDKILPTFAQKYGRKWGARVGETEVRTTEQLSPAERKNLVTPDVLRRAADLADADKQPAYAKSLREQADKVEGGAPLYYSFAEPGMAVASYVSRVVDFDRGAAARAHSIDITPEMKRSVLSEGQPLFQENKAAVEFMQDGRAILRAFQKADVSSAVHELSHVFRRDLPENLLKDAEEAIGVKGGKWTTPDEEKFARGFERYLKTGEAPTVKLRRVFESFKTWLTEIYGAVRGKNHPLNYKPNEKLTAVFDRMLGGEPKGEYGQLIHALHKAPDAGTPAFFENAQVKRALGLKPDASTADVRAALTEQVGKPRSSHLTPDDVRGWADSKGLQGAARAALDDAVAKFETKTGKEVREIAEPDPVEQYTATLSDAERAGLQPFDRMLEDERAGELVDALYDPASDLATAESRLRRTAQSFGVSGEHVDALVADARKGREPDYRTPKLAPVASLNLDPARFQYKLNPGRGGQTGSLSDVSKWNTDLEGVVQIWRDPADGKDYVVNGHNRVAKAKDLGVGELPVRYVKAETAKEARAVGALVNIGEGNGTALDAAKFFKDAGLTPEDLKAAGVPLQKKVATEGLALSRLSEPVFNAVVSKTLPHEYGVAIGERTADETLQTQALSAIRKAEAKGRRLDRAVVAEMMDAVTAAPRRTETEQTLFGSFTNERSLYAERAQAAASLKRLMSQDKSLFGTAARRAERLGEGGTRVDVDAARELSETAREALEVFDQLKNRSGAISDILDESAKRIAGGQRPDAAAKEAYEGVKQAVSQTLGRGARGGQAPAGDAGSKAGRGELGARPGREAGTPEPATPEGQGDSLDTLYQSAHKPEQLGFTQDELVPQSARREPPRPKVSTGTGAAERALGADTAARLSELKASPAARLASEVERRVTTSNAGNAPDVVAALAKLAELKRTKQTVDDYLNQGSLFGERELTPAQERILSALDRNPRKVLDEAFPAEAKPQQDVLFQADTSAASRRQRAYRALLEAKGQGSLAPDLKAPAPKLTTGQQVARYAGVFRSLKSSWDLSAAGRQAAMYTVTHPARATRLFFGKQLASLKETNYDKFVSELGNHPRARQMRDAELYLASQAGKDPKAVEEAFPTDLAGRIPLIGRGVKASERAYVTFLDAARADWFDQLARQAEDAAKTEGRNLTTDDFKAIATVINRATGRGSLGKGAINDAAPLLNSIFFAPRYTVSRVQVLDPRIYARLPKGARQTAVRQAVQYYGTLATTAALLSYMGLEVGTDPETAEFMKLKVGDTRYDLTAGQGQYVTLAARLHRNFQNRRQGKPDPFGNDASANLARWARYKLAPLPAFALNVAKGKDAVGQPTSLTKESVEAISPIFLKDMYEAFEREGLLGVAKESPAFVGVGVNTYKPRKPDTGRTVRPPQRRVSQ